ncbi:AAA family ATPase [Streptomyces microflavus]|uniref:AAA family ATPase n=1 Tax=Streptomyces microflavus TaxID=1919 RepID=UPI0036B48962
MKYEDGTWRLFGEGGAPPSPRKLPPGPPWRRFGQKSRPRAPYVIRPEDVDVVNTALHLRRPLLVTGFPGVGKSSLAHEIARQLGLGELLVWPVNSRSTLSDALYRYDAVARLRDAALAVGGQARDGDTKGLPDSAPSATAAPAVEEYITLGPLGTALAAEPGKPRVLLIDELDKSDLDLPNDLLVVFEDGAFEIPELSRQATSDDTTADVALADGPRALAPADGSSAEAGAAASRNRGTVVGGWVTCAEFPVIVITSNGERDFPPAFLRRCVTLNLGDPTREELQEIIEAHFSASLAAEDIPQRELDELVKRFRTGPRAATDQLLNAVHLRLSGVPLDDNILRSVLMPLDGTEADGLPRSTIDLPPPAPGRLT